MSTSLYQIHSATPIQMMSYVIKTENGKLMEIAEKYGFENVVEFIEVIE